MENVRAGWVPLFVREGNDVPEGNRELIKRGARPLGSEDLVSSFDGILDTAVLRPQPTLVRESAAPYAADEDMQTSGDLFPVLWPRLAEFLLEPRTEAEVADAFHLQKAQVQAWLQRALDEGRVRKLSDPIRFVRIQTTADPQASLFER
jgi:DNA processing protein